MSKILIVEDDNNLREIYGARLEAEGYEISSAHDGEEALALAIKERPILILTDIMMPKISGFDMIDILRSTTETKDIKVVITTALSQPGDQQRGEQLGADRYLVKSQGTLEDVITAIHEVLGDAPVSPHPAPAPIAEPQGVPPPVAPAQVPVEPQVPSQFVPQPVAPVPPVPAATQPQSAPATQTPVAPAPQPVAPAPAQVPVEQPIVASSPQPTPEKGSNRTIQPLSDDQTAPSFQDLVAKELGGTETDQQPPTQ